MAEVGEISVRFTGGRQVEATVGRHVVKTDQPVDAGGEDAAPAPYALFLSSLATCAGFFVLRFCQQREIPTDGVRLVQRTETDPETKRLLSVALELELPPSFPERYRSAVARVVDQCSVKRAIEAQPSFTVTVAAPAEG